MGTALSISNALQQAVAALQQARVGEPRLTAEVLLCAVLGRDKAFLYGHADEELDYGQAARYQAAIRRRCTGVPTQYITGRQEFYGLPFHVTPDVLIPRPETELLVEQALQRARAGDRILDIGTGSGAVALAILRHLPETRVFASDVSRAALSVAGGNARSLGLELPLVEADMAEAFGKGALDMIVCNPPYVSLLDMPCLQKEVRDHEPHLALFGGEDGLDAYRRLSATVCDLLRPRGWLLLEVGYNTSAAVKTLFGGAAWEKPSVYRDLAGWDRVLAVQRAAAGTTA
jgi:release factor glutamine methyltransferase